MPNRKKNKKNCPPHNLIQTFYGQNFYCSTCRNFFRLEKNPKSKIMEYKIIPPADYKKFNIPIRSFPDRI